MRIVGKAGAASIRAEGEVADITRFRHIDADFAISGPNLASLYQTLKVALPDTPPYEARDRLTRNGDAFAYESFKGTIGATDVAGSARFELRKPRPMLSAELRSERLDLADLGPLVGARAAAAAKTEGADGREPDARRRDRGGGADTRAVKTAAGEPARVLPGSGFTLEKLNAMGAGVRLSAVRLREPGQVRTAARRSSP